MSKINLVTYTFLAGEMKTSSEVTSNLFPREFKISRGSTGVRSLLSLSFVRNLYRHQRVKSTRFATGQTSGGIVHLAPSRSSTTLGAKRPDPHRGGLSARRRCARRRKKTKNRKKRKKRALSGRSSRRRRRVLGSQPVRGRRTLSTATVAGSR